MTRLFALLVAALGIVGILTLPGQANEIDPRRTGFAITNVNVLPMTGEAMLSDQTVVVREGRIVALTPSRTAQIPTGMPIIEGRGKWLMPGMAELHAHVPEANDRAFRETVLYLFVANGVTTIRNMQGDESHLRLRDLINEGKVFGPRIFTASPWLGHDNAETPEMARETVRRYFSDGYDLLKIGEIPRPAYLAMATTAQEIGIPFGGHVPRDVGLSGAIEAGQSSIDHLDGYVRFLARTNDEPVPGDSGFFGSALVAEIDDSRLSQAVELTKRHGAWVVPTMSHFEHLATEDSAREMIAWPEMKYIPSRMRRDWIKAKEDFEARDDFTPQNRENLSQLRRRILASLYRGGAKIAGGSDAPQFFNVPGFSLHRELVMMVEAGIEPIDALRSVTSAPAEHLQSSHEFGTIAPGIRGDLILLSANPAEDIASIRKIDGVALNGLWLDRAELDRGLREAEARSAAANPFSRKELAMMGALGLVLISGVVFLVLRKRGKSAMRKA